MILTDLSVWRHTHSIAISVLESEVQAERIVLPDVLSLNYVIMYSLVLNYIVKHQFTAPHLSEVNIAWS